MNALFEGFAYKWLVINPPAGRTIADEKRSRSSPTSSTTASAGRP